MTPFYQKLPNTLADQCPGGGRDLLQVGFDPRRSVQATATDNHRWNAVEMEFTVSKKCADASNKRNKIQNTFYITAKLKRLVEERRNSIGLFVSQDVVLVVGECRTEKRCQFQKRDMHGPLIAPQS